MTTRRGRGEGSIYHDAGRGRYVGVLDVTGPGSGKRTRRKVSATTKTGVRTKLDALRRELADAGAAGPTAGRGAPPGSRRSWDCLVPDCFARSVTKAPVLLCADHRDLLLAQHGKAKAHDPVVYFLRNGNRVKIGWTTNLQGRIRSLSLPMSAVLATMPGGPAQESDMHGRFASAHIEHEWFEFTPDIEAFVGTLVTDRAV